MRPPHPSWKQSRGVAASGGSFQFCFCVWEWKSEYYRLHHFTFLIVTLVIDNKFVCLDIFGSFDSISHIINYLPYDLPTTPPPLQKIKKQKQRIEKCQKGLGKYAERGEKYVCSFFAGEEVEGVVFAEGTGYQKPVEATNEWYERRFRNMNNQKF